jgi:hypothetical protein
MLLDKLERFKIRASIEGEQATYDLVLDGWGEFCRYNDVAQLASNVIPVPPPTPTEELLGVDKARMHLTVSSLRADKVHLTTTVNDLEADKGCLIKIVRALIPEDGVPIVLGHDNVFYMGDLAGTAMSDEEVAILRGILT